MAKTLDVGPAVGDNGRGRNRGRLLQRSPGPEQKRWRCCILVTATYVGAERSQLACVSVLGEGQPIKISEKIKCLLISLQVLSKKSVRKSENIAFCFEKQEQSWLFVSCMCRRPG